MELRFRTGLRGEMGPDRPRTPPGRHFRRFLVPGSLSRRLLSALGWDPYRFGLGVLAGLPGNVEDLHCLEL